MANILVPSKQVRWSDVMKYAEAKLQQTLAIRAKTASDRMKALSKAASETTVFQSEVLGRSMGVIPKDIYAERMRDDPFYWYDKKNVEKFFKENPEAKQQAPDGYKPKYFFKNATD